MSIKVKASPEAVKRATEEGLHLVEIVIDNTHIMKSNGALRITGAVSPRILKRLTNVIADWMKEERS